MFIGIDLGGTFIKYGLFESDFNTVFSDSIPTGISEEAIVLDLINIIRDLIKMSENDFDEKVLAIGVGVPGVVTGDLEYIEECKNLNWKRVPLKRMLEAGVGIPVFLENDANLAALAEYKVGSLEGAKRGVLLTLGTGIGSGTIIDGDLYRGSNGLGQELGHMVIGDNFYDCSCGKNGCFETFSSATAVVMYAKKLLRKSSLITNFRWRVKYSISAKDIFERAKKGDKFALEVLERTCDYLAKGIVNIINILDPDIISLGGGMATSGDLLINMTRQRVNKDLFIKDFPSATLKLAKVGNKAGIIGSAILAQKEYNRRSL